MKIQEDKDANTWMKMQKIWRLWTLHISLFSWVSIFFSHQPFLLQCYHFFHHPSPEELSLDIILGLSQSFFVIQQVYSWVNQILDSSIGLVLVMAKANMTRSSHTNLNRDFKPCLSSLFLCTIPIFQGSQNNPMKIQEDKDANKWMEIQRVWRLWTFHISTLSWVSIFFSHPPFSLQYYHFFAYQPSPKELSLDIILRLSQSFFVI